MGGAVCPRCAQHIALYEGKPHVNAAGVVELWHPSCWLMHKTRHVERPQTEPAPPPPPKVIGKIIATVVVGSALTISTLQWAWLEHTMPATSLANIAVDTGESVPIRAKGSSRELVPMRPQTVETAAQIRYPVPMLRDQPLDELYPSLRGWVHPITNSPELMPEQASRHFGAERKGIERAECGAGHCGVDLDGPRGRPIVAVADGTVVRIERSEMGLDGRSGRYVRIEHDDGTLTAYMHLDDIAEGLEVRDRVQAGQMIGTLGATAVFTAPPHCHFSLEIPNQPGLHGDNTDTTYVDPAPFLVRAHIVPVPDRRRSEKPQM